MHFNTCKSCPGWDLEGPSPPRRGNNNFPRILPSFLNSMKDSLFDFPAGLERGWKLFDVVNSPWGFFWRVFHASSSSENI